MAQWLCDSCCNPEVAGSIPGFFSLSDEKYKPRSRLHMTLAVGGTLNPKSIKNSYHETYIQQLTQLPQSEVSMKAGTYDAIISRPTYLFILGAKTKHGVPMQYIHRPHMSIFQPFGAHKLYEWIAILCT